MPGKMPALPGLMLLLLTAVLVATAAAPVPAQTADLADLRRAFERPPDDARIMMRWWWFGPAVTKSGLEREMRLMKDGGIGGFEIQPVYPVALDDPSTGFRNLPYLSEEFLDALRFTSQKARELGLRVDLTVGSGWPYGGPQVPITQAAARLRHDRVRMDGKSRRIPVPYSGAGEKLLRVFAASSNGQPTGHRDVTGHVSDGILWLPPGFDGPHEILFFFLSRTGQQVKRAAAGAEGYVLNHYDRAALDDYLAKVGEPMLRAFGANPPYAIFCDSLEVYGADWTGDFPEEFRKRRGYDVMPHLPLLVSGAAAEGAAIRYDWGKT